MLETILIFLLKAVTVVTYCAFIVMPFYILFLIVRALRHDNRR